MGTSLPSALDERAKSPKVFGILSIIFASITLLFSLFSLLGMMAAGNFSALGQLAGRRGEVDAEIMREMMSVISGIYDYGAISSGVFIAFSAALLAVGIGQVGYRRWAQKASVLWGWGALASLIALGVLLFVMVGPIYDRLFQIAGAAGENDPQVRALIQSANIGPVASMGGAIFMFLFFAPYPILLLAFFNKDRVKASMSS